MSTIQIQLSETAAGWLERTARNAGAKPAEIASAVLEDAAKAGAARLVDASGLSAQERLRRFDEHMAKVPARPGPPVDTSRESIYD